MHLKVLDAGCMNFNGFGFTGYRSFSGDIAKLAPLKKINFIIGQNNCGKSNIINFLSDIYPHFKSKVNQSNNSFSRNGKESPFTQLDIPIGGSDYSLAAPLNINDSNSYLIELFKNHDQYTRNNLIKIAMKILKCDAFFNDGDNFIWFEYTAKHYDQPLVLNFSIDDIKPLTSDSNWRNLWSALTGKSGGGLTSHWIPESVRCLAKAPDILPPIEVIPAIRKIGDSGTQASDFSGNGIIERLAKIQNPELEKQSDKKKFHDINKFLQIVLENNTANIEIPHDRTMILVHMDDKTLPLSSLGTGIHEVIILAAASTLLENTIVCIEEPELHLHPLLQRKLVKFLSKNTTNKYFFTTHSAHLLDATEAEIFHVTQSDGISKLDAISSTKERSKICQDLGYKASDILQANCIIWVEGPSDRTYLNYWIQSKDAELIEGIHYNIMFYGGRLASHLSANDPDELSNNEEHLISLRKLNRNSVIMMDSDKPSPRTKINNTKKRLDGEFNDGNGFSWITEGREVENYLNEENLEESIIKVHSKTAKNIKDKGKWKNLLIYNRKERAKKGQVTNPTANKVKVAEYYVDNYPADLSTYDLNKKVTQLTDFIQLSNGIKLSTIK